MSMTKTEKIQFSGNSTIDGKVCARFNATIDPDNPDNLSMTFMIIDKTGYRDNRDQCHKDQAEFEDEVYEAQAQMLEKEAKVEDYEDVKVGDDEYVEETDY